MVNVLVSDLRKLCWEVLDLTLQRLEGVWPYRDCWKFASKWRNVRFMKKTGIIRKAGKLWRLEAAGRTWNGRPLAHWSMTDGTLLIWQWPWKCKRGRKLCVGKVAMISWMWVCCGEEQWWRGSIQVRQSLVLKEKQIQERMEMSTYLEKYLKRYHFSYRCEWNCCHLKNLEKSPRVRRGRERRTREENWEECLVRLEWRFKEEASCCDLFHLYNHLVVSFPFVLLSLLELYRELGCEAISTASHLYCIILVLQHISTVSYQYYITSVLHNYQYCIASVLHHISIIPHFIFTALSPIY